MEQRWSVHGWQNAPGSTTSTLFRMIRVQVDLGKVVKAGIHPHEAIQTLGADMCNDINNVFAS
jgi:hypothetical protein